MTQTWTIEQTIERRAAWNAAINAGEIMDGTGKVVTRKLAALVARLGYGQKDLILNVMRHDLDGKRAAFAAEHAQSFMARGLD